MRGVPVRSESLADGFCFSKRWQCFKSEKVRGFCRRVRRRGLDALAMKLDKISEVAGVVAVIFGAVVEGCSIGTREAAMRTCLLGNAGGLAGERD